MKRIFTLIICFLMLFSFACGKSSSSSSSVTDSVGGYSQSGKGTSSSVSLQSQSSQGTSSILSSSEKTSTSSDFASSSNLNSSVNWHSSGSSSQSSVISPSASSGSNSVLSSANSSSSSSVSSVLSGASSSSVSSSSASTSSGSSNSSSSGSNSSGSSGGGSQEQEDITDISSYLISENDIPLKLHYNSEAPVTSSEHEDEATWYSDESWEKLSLPLGNGYFGANVFGRTETERIQISEKTITNPHYFAAPYGICKGGLNNFSETFIDFGHTNSDVSNYTRYLDLKTAISGVDYVYNGVNYSREYFTSYPDKALVIKLDASGNGNLSFTLRPTIPFEQDYLVEEGDNKAKHGTVTSTVQGQVGVIELSGNMSYYGIDFMAIYKVYTNGGTVTASTTQHSYQDTSGATKTDTDGTIIVSNATSAFIVVTLGTDYELTSEVFTSSDSEKPTQSTTLEDTRLKVEGDMTAIENRFSGLSFVEKYELLKSRHVEDYSNLFGRYTVNLNCTESDFSTPTDDLLASYKNGMQSNYLELLLQQYGRYMLIASSRENTLPAHLQGIWNTYNSPAWSSGYWHNINVQMNYWPAFSTNIAETFQGYINYNNAFMEAAEAFASQIIQEDASDKLGQDGGNGWTVGTAATPYYITIDSSSGNLGFTTQLFWEYYAFTQDKEALEEIVYPVLYSAAQFITKIVVEDENGNYLVKYCDSPEQYVDGVWYYTSGTTYAQSFAYLNNYNLLLAAKELGIDLTDQAVLNKEENAVLKTVLEQIDKYDPIIVGLSGQIKEFREELYYGNLGQWEHRHISNLVGLFPGNLINTTTPAWIDASKVVLDERGDASVGWSLAHKINLWARMKDGNKAHENLVTLFNDNIAPNLWDLYDAEYYRGFQIDANLGTTSGITEMLLQSDAGYIEPLAALPDVWHTGSYTGLVARGNFEISARWENGFADSLNILSKSDGKAYVYYPSVTGAVVRDIDGRRINYTVEGTDLISFDTEVGQTYVIYGFVAQEKLDAPQGFTYTRENFEAFNFTWEEVEGAQQYNVYVAVESQPDYTLIGTVDNNSFTYLPNQENLNVRMTFVVTAIAQNKRESSRTLCYYNAIPVVDGIKVDTVKDNVYGTAEETVLLDGDRSYSLSAVKTQSGVFIYAKGIFNTCCDDRTSNSWTDKTNFEFKLNGGAQSYVNVLKQFKGVTHFDYTVEALPNGKYQHTVEIFVAKELIQNWSDTQDVQINYAWKTPGENAYIISDMIDYQYIDWNTDWHSYHRLGGLSTYYAPVQANLFIGENGLVTSNIAGIEGVISSGEYAGSSITASSTSLNVDLKGKVENGDLYLAFTIIHDSWSSYNNTTGSWHKNDNIELYVNGQKMVIMFFNGQMVLPAYITQGNTVTTTNQSGKYETVVELYIKGDAPSYNIVVGIAGDTFSWLNVVWGPDYAVVSENGVVRNGTVALSDGVVLDGNLTDSVWTETVKTNKISTTANGANVEIMGTKTADGVYLAAVVKHSVAPNVSVNGTTNWYTFTNVEFRLNGNETQILHTVKNQNPTKNVFGYCKSVENGDGTYTSTFEIFVSNSVVGITLEQTQVDMSVGGWFETNFTGLFGTSGWSATHIVSANGIVLKN